MQNGNTSTARAYPNVFIEPEVPRSISMHFSQITHCLVRTLLYLVFEPRISVIVGSTKLFSCQQMKHNF